ncbi:MAG: DUF928 domain-containing protein [Leptolyngbya sp. BL-A-14]
MIRTKLISWISVFVFTFAFFFTSFTAWVPPAEAGCIFIFFCSKSKSSFGSKGGVRRGPCAEDFDLVALAPDRQRKSALAPEQPLEATAEASTVEGYPSFWFYVPHYKPSTISAKFVLLDENNHLVRSPIYTQLPQTSSEFPQSKTSGVIAELTLPNDEEGLDVGKKYTWYFSLLCDFQKPSRNPEVTGQIQRVLQGPLPRLPEPAYVVHNNTYIGQENIESVVFYDTVTQLAKRQGTYPSDWHTLLSKAGIPSAAGTVKIVKLQPLDKPPAVCGSSSNSTA